jgi:hypothetical protein
LYRSLSCCSVRFENEEEGGSLDLERERLSSRRVRGFRGITKGLSVCLIGMLSIPVSIAAKVSAVLARNWGLMLFSDKFSTITLSVAISVRLLYLSQSRGTSCLRVALLVGGGVLAQVLLYKLSVNYLFFGSSHPVRRVLNKKYLIGTAPALPRLQVRQSAHIYQLSLPQISQAQSPRRLADGRSALSLEEYCSALRLCFSPLCLPCGFACDRGLYFNEYLQTSRI